jgi:hypothetical protein
MFTRRTRRVARAYGPARTRGWSGGFTGVWVGVPFLDPDEPGVYEVHAGKEPHHLLAAAAYVLLLCRAPDDVVETLLGLLVEQV